MVRHDTLYSIAWRCGFGVGAIARANRIDPTRIEVGQRLVLPRGDGGRVRLRETGALTYRFRQGDTLYSLARWARVDLRALLAANPGIDPQGIDAGAAIRLPRGAVPARARRLRRARGPQAVAPSPPRDDDVDEEAGKPDAGPEGREEDERGIVARLSRIAEISQLGQSHALLPIYSGAVGIVTSQGSLPEEEELAGALIGVDLGRQGRRVRESSVTWPSKPGSSGGHVAMIRAP